MAQKRPAVGNKDWPADEEYWQQWFPKGYGK